jgi:hypothetical protein
MKFLAQFEFRDFDTEDFFSSERSFEKKKGFVSMSNSFSMAVDLGLTLQRR